MLNEKWKIFGNDIIPTDHYEVSEVVQGMDGTKICLNGQKNKLIIKYGFVDALRVSDEGRRLRTYNEVKEIQEYRKDFMGYPLYEVENSEFLEWIKIESAGFYSDMKHYALITINDIVDIISTFPPEIELEIKTESYK